MTDNLVAQYFIKGGWIMWPILLTSIVAVAVIVERSVWWIMERRKRDPERLEKVYAALGNGDLQGRVELGEERGGILSCG